MLTQQIDPQIDMRIVLTQQIELQIVLPTTANGKIVVGYKLAIDSSSDSERLIFWLNVRTGGNSEGIDSFHSVMPIQRYALITFKSARCVLNRFACFEART